MSITVNKRERTKKAREEFRAIVDTIKVRARGFCECGCGRSLVAGAHADHWLGGNGRRLQEQSVQNVWLLAIAPCDYDRTRNFPSVKHWNDKFKAHCEKYGYPFTPHKDRHADGLGDGNATDQAK